MWSRRSIQFNITHYKMRKLAIFILSLPSVAFAAAGFADAYYDHQQWIFPAYAYCLVFGLTILFSLVTVSLIYKAKTRYISEQISSYLIKHRILAIIIIGILLAIPIGIIGSVSWEIIWFLSVFPFMGLMVIFPIILINKCFREKYLLSLFWIKWSLFISISSIAASLLFIILADCNLLTGTDITYLARPDRLHQGFYSPTHPNDSMKEIWFTPLFFIGEIVIALLLYFIGILNRYFCGVISKYRQRREKETISA